MKYLDALLRFFNQEEYTHREDVAIIISDIFEANPDITLENFTKEIKKIRRDFFRINKLKRNNFAEDVFNRLSKVRKERPTPLDSFEQAKKFVSNNFEIGYDQNRFLAERLAIVNRFSEVKKPHDALMEAFNKLLDKILVSYTIDLHGVKEYSGIDICKKIGPSTLGFQIKTKDDDISEHMIRSETSKAQDWKMDGFVLIYARKKTKKVDASIQGAYHHFRTLNKLKITYCALIDPILLAELFRSNSITL